ncbi:early transcribed membrane protein [Plasmodium vinckei vinckei]|uniref:Early transcribed membrane protein n=1 Tax=Plasmodium vinckei vinckei TaxID=54757 RepID=A0A449BPA7_PLAVN|nr:early transcribed membrane protein [Plasmodium vinckei vinckei]VEV55290.1 early transcribed membrane protein [Plasmodium vinckei vinckei]
MKISKIFVLFNLILISHYLTFGMSRRAAKGGSFKKFRDDLAKFAKNRKALLITLGSIIGAAAVSAGVGYGIYKKKNKKYRKPGYFKSQVTYTPPQNPQGSKNGKVSVIEARLANQPITNSSKSAPAPAKSAPAKSAPAKSAPAKSAPAKSAPAKSAPAPAKSAPTPAKSAPAPAKSAPAPAKSAPAPAKSAPAPAKSAPAPAKSGPAPPSNVGNSPGVYRPTMPVSIYEAYNL